MTWPDYVSPLRYPGLSDEELEDQLCVLTQDLVNERQDLGRLSVSHNAQFFQVFLDSNGESVAARNRLAEAATAEVEQERIVGQANILSIEDLCALLRTMLEQRRGRG